MTSYEFVPVERDDVKPGDVILYSTNRGRTVVNRQYEVTGKGQESFLIRRLDGGDEFASNLRSNPIQVRKEKPLPEKTEYIGSDTYCITDWFGDSASAILLPERKTIAFHMVKGSSIHPTAEQLRFLLERLEA